MSNLKGEDAVLVTGGTGYLAGWMIVGLLRAGFHVRTTVRDLGKQTELRKAIEMEVHGAGDRLSFAKADLVRDEGWTTAVNGCRYVMHLASPMGQGAPKGADLVGPARDGTLRVLRAASACGAERVVLTSSGLAAQTRTVSGEMQPLADEDTWTDLDEKGISEYARSKVLAERAAWEFVRSKESGTTLTTILPGLILGAALTRNISPSLQLVAGLLSGKMAALPHVGFCITEVHDLVNLHIKAMTNPSAANQRIIGIGDFLWLAEIAETLSEAFPERAAKIPRRRVPDWVMRVLAVFQEEARFMVPMLGKRREFSSSKALRLLQWTATPSKDAVLKCAQSLIDKKIV